MSRRAAPTKEQTAADRRALEIRRGVLLAHLVLEVIVVVGAHLGWWSVFRDDQLVGSVAGRQFQDAALAVTSYRTAYVGMVLGTVVTFLFTSYDLVADADIQWPPLLACAFVLGCSGQVVWRLHRDFDVIVEKELLREEVMRRRAGTAAVGSGADAPRGAAPLVTAGAAAPVGSGAPPGATAAGPLASPAAAGQEGLSVHVGPGTRTDPIRVQVDAGLKMVLFGSLCMVALSAYLTLFARRDP